MIARAPAAPYPSTVAEVRPPVYRRPPIALTPPGRSTRRRFLGVAAAGLGLGLLGCGEEDLIDPGPPVPTPPRAATPVGAVAGYGDDRWSGRTLRLAAYGDDIQDLMERVVWQPFAAATGCSVEPAVVDLSRLAADRAEGRAPHVDAMLVDAPWAQGASERGELAPLDAALTGRADLDLVDGTDFAQPAFAYAMVNAYRRDERDSLVGVPRTWREWWDRQRFPGDRTLRKDALGTFEFALMGVGVAPSDLYPLDLERAVDGLRAISGRIVDRWWETGGQAVGWLARNRADYGSAWSYRVAAAQANGAAVELVWDQGLLLADVWVVPAGAANADVAMDFARYATRPETQAALAVAAGLSPVTSDAFARLDPLTTATLATAPRNLPKLIRQDVAWWAENEIHANAAFNRWLLGTPS